MIYLGKKHNGETKVNFYQLTAPSAATWWLILTDSNVSICWTLTMFSLHPRLPEPEELPLQQMHGTLLRILDSLSFLAEYKRKINAGPGSLSCDYQSVTHISQEIVPTHQSYIEPEQSKSK